MNPFSLLINRILDIKQNFGLEKAISTNFETLRQKSPKIDEQLIKLIQDENKSGDAYHCLDFGKGNVILGDYDMTKYLPYYHIPGNLKNKHVLDIGSASGFFALDSARRGAKVTAIDIHEKPILSRVSPLLNADIKYIQKSIYDINKSLGEFDLVICGSVILHLPDPFGAIQKIRSVCRGQAIVSTASCTGSYNRSRPFCEFRGLKASDGDYYHYWDISANALKTMLLTAGFSEVRNIHHFNLASEKGRTTFDTPHVVMTGIV